MSATGYSYTLIVTSIWLTFTPGCLSLRQRQCLRILRAGAGKYAHAPLRTGISKATTADILSPAHGVVWN